MKLYLSEVTENEKSLEFTEVDTWVQEAIASLDETLEDEPAPIQSPSRKPEEPKTRPAQIHFQFHKLDDSVLLSGQAKASLKLLCSRCACTFDHACEIKFTSLFSTEPADGSTPIGGGTNPAALKGRTKGFARHAHNFDEDPFAEVDMTYLTEDFIDLSGVLTEQLMLRVPFQPLCKDECKGVCFQCGTDLNAGRCACSKIHQEKPFSVLKDFHVKPGTTA